MSEELYQRLFREVNAQRFDSREAHEVCARLGPPALAFRAFALARRHAWGSVQSDLRRALEAPAIDPKLALVCGVGCFVARDYDRSLVALRRAIEHASHDKLRAEALKLALGFASALGWTQEALELRQTIASLRERARARSPGKRPGRVSEAEARRQRAARARQGPPERAASQAYALVFRDGPEAAAACLDALLREHPEHPDLLAARLRLDLLLDRLEQASERASAIDTAKHAHASLRAELCALALAWGDAEQALQLSTDPGSNPRLLYLRGLAVGELLDDVERAAELFAAARTLAPNSVTITLALTLARHRLAPRSFGEGLERSYEHLSESAPALLADASSSAGLHAWTDQGLSEARPDRVTILRRAHGMLSAERDVQLTSYACRSCDGQLRLRHVAVAHAGADPSHFAALHRDDRERITHYEAELVRVIGHRPPAPEQPGAQPEAAKDERLAPRCSLSDQQVEQFLTDGYIVLRQAFDPALAARMREAAIERLQTEPHKWVRGYDPGDATRSLRDFSPTDPSTWTWPRLELLGPEQLVIEEFAPRAWAAICDLLGGPGRIQTRSWGDYMLLNLCDNDRLVGDQPPPSASSWHIDDPNPATRIDRIRNGLVCIALFDDLQPASGNTWLALDSVARVARELAAHPEGVDFVHDRGNRITAQCQRFASTVGQAGDIWLLHPLMMHSASRNLSGRIRWMSNPMVYLDRPLDPYRAPDQLSPVELAMRRAIDSD